MNKVKQSSQFPIKDSMDPGAHAHGLTLSVHGDGNDSDGGFVPLMKNVSSNSRPIPICYAGRDTCAVDKGSIFDDDSSRHKFCMASDMSCTILFCLF